MSKRQVFPSHSSTQNASGITLSKPNEIQMFYFSKLLKSLLLFLLTLLSEDNERETLWRTQKSKQIPTSVSEQRKAWKEKHKDSSELTAWRTTDAKEQRRRVAASFLISRHLPSRPPAMALKHLPLWPSQFRLSHFPEGSHEVGSFKRITGLNISHNTYKEINWP